MLHFLLVFLFALVTLCNSDGNSPFFFFGLVQCSQCPLWIWNCFTLQVTILHSKSDEWVIPGARQRNSFCLLKGSFCLRLLNCHSSDFCTHTKKRCWGCSTVEPICICQCCLLFVSNGLGVQCFSLFINLDKKSEIIIFSLSDRFHKQGHIFLPWLYGLCVCPEGWIGEGCFGLFFLYLPEILKQQEPTIYSCWLCKCVRRRFGGKDALNAVWHFNVSCSINFKQREFGT